MPKLNVQIDFPEESWKPFLDSLGPMSVLLAPPGVYLYKICDAVSQGRPLRIVETGCLRNTDPSAIIQDGWSTFYFSKWGKNHPGSSFDSVELDPKSISLCGQFLKQHELSEHVRFWNFDSMSLLETWDQPVDVFFLDSCDGLDHGLAEFKAALEFRPCTIIMDDYDTKARLADEYAKSIGIPSQRMDRYTVFQIPR
jgi:Methyltransferase domain